MANHKRGSGVSKKQEAKHYQQKLRNPLAQHLRRKGHSIEPDARKAAGKQLCRRKITLIGDDVV